MEHVVNRHNETNNVSSAGTRHSLTTEERKNIDLSAEIPGWGSDMERNIRPGVPADKAPELGAESLYIDIEQQIPRGRIFKSTEHAHMTPVFGTACPPRGLSGLIRSLAYRLNEGRLSHWVLLLLADRIDVVEQILIDLFRGFQLPQVFREMGLVPAPG